MTVAVHPEWVVKEMDDLRIQGLQAPEVVHQMLLRRGITDLAEAEAFLDPQKYTLSSTEDWPDIHHALTLAKEAISSRTIICVWGDFDVDGQTATALLVRGLRNLGASVIYYIPDRIEEGHGLNTTGLSLVRGRKAGLLITCDCGTSDDAEIQFAQALGMKVIVTDHHTPPEVLPPAEAILNPHRLPETHPGRPLCGVGVAYILIKALYDTLGRPMPRSFLAWVALGTIADVAQLTGDNRYLVQCGLAALIRQPSVHIRALMQTAGEVFPEVLDARLVGFILAPRLNAVGRLAHARQAVEFLLADHPNEAIQAAERFELLNDQRKQQSAAVEMEVKVRVHQNPALQNASALVLADPGWHPGIIGPVAGRLAEQYQKPAALVVVGQEGIGRASARSVAGVDLFEALKKHQVSLLQVGGHAMAAGFTIEMENLPAFTRAFQATIRKMRGTDPIPPKRLLEAYVDLGELTEDWVRSVFQLGPFGAGHPVPVWGLQNVQLVNVTGLGARQTHSKLRVTNGQGEHRPAIWWRKPPHEVPKGRVDVAFTIELDTYLGKGTPRLLIEAVRPAESDHNKDQEEKTNVFALQDARNETNRRAKLAEWKQANPGVQVWGEGQANDLPPGSRTRTELKRGDCLVIWSTPPGPKTLREVLNRVQPQSLFLLTVNERISYGSPVKTLLKGLLKYIKSNPENRAFALEAPAAHLGHRSETIQLALDQLQAMGMLRYACVGAQVHVYPGEEHMNHKQSPELKRMLDETAAYRRYFNRVEPRQLVR